MNQQLFELVIDKIFKFSGIKVSLPQEETLKNFLKKKADDSKKSIQQFCDELMPGSEIFNELINLVTVNETYFFREQKQFELLESKIFPLFTGKKMNIWSGASSTGEEAISLLSMALSFNIDATVYATDIDDNVITTLKMGEYSGFSFREDGKKYHSLLNNFYTERERKYVFNQDFIKKIKVEKYNLTSDDVFPFYEKMDLIFLRNVFIYFDKDTRTKVCKKIVSKLKDGGHLFFSMNEVGCLDTSIIPPDLTKVNYGEVYFFEKEAIGESFVSFKTNTSARSNNTLDSKASNQNGTQTKVNPLLEKIAAQVAEKKAAKNSAIKKKNVGSNISQIAIRQNNKKTAANVKQTENNLKSGLTSESTSALSIKNIFQQIGDHINKNNFEMARNMLEKVQGIENKVYQYFFEGYIEYHADNKENAERLFSSAELVKQNFWPAYFYHGLVLKDFGKDEKARFCFKRCMEILNEHKEHNPYNFIIDSFSPDYIYSLCNTFQES